MSLKYMAQKCPGELTSAKEISDNMRLPFDATARVLQAMAHHQLLHVEQGAQGGYSIRRDLNKVSFHDLVEMIDGRIEIVRCLHGDDCDLLPTCNIQSPINVLNRKLAQFYQGLLLGDILRLREPAVLQGMPT